MESLFSGLIAETLMQCQELIALPCTQSKVWIKYVDDTFVIIRKDQLKNTHKTINHIFKGIEFTKEEENNTLLCLGILFSRDGDGKS